MTAALFPPPLAMPVIADPLAMEQLLRHGQELLAVSGRDSSMVATATPNRQAQPNAPASLRAEALSAFRAVGHYCRTAFLRGQVISGDMRPLEWQVLDLAIRARHYILAAAVARRLTLQGDDDPHRLFAAGLNWLQLLIKLERSDTARRWGQRLLADVTVLPSAEQGEKKSWLACQLADLALKEDDIATTRHWLTRAEDHVTQLAGDDLASYWRIMAFSHLQAGDYRTGFHFYEQRGVMSDPAFPYFPHNPLHLPAKKWQGQKTRKLLITAEQGLGDTIQFIRFVPSLRQQATSIVLEVQRPLVRLLRDHWLPAIDPAVDNGRDPAITIVPLGNVGNAGGVSKAGAAGAGGLQDGDIDHWCSLLSLPYLLQEKMPAPHASQPLPATSRPASKMVADGAGAATISAGGHDDTAMQPLYQPAMPYLRVAMPPRGQHPLFDRHPLYCSHKKYRVGLTWATSIGGPSGHARTIDLRHLWPLFADPSIARVVDFYSLQLLAGQGPAPASPASAHPSGLSPPPNNLNHHGFGGFMRDLTPYMTDMADTAGLVAGLDAVITVDTAILHLAGALGKTTLVLIPHHADWRWGRQPVARGGDQRAVSSGKGKGNRCEGGCYWYPDTHVVFRQPRKDDWAGAVRALRARLLPILQATSRGA